MHKAPLFNTLKIYVMKYDVTQEKKQEYKNLGHGTYDTITNEKEFFEISKKSVRVVCLFYIDTSFRLAL